eukprot:PITA_03788
MERPTPRDEMPLQPQVTFKLFDKWGMEFIGPIDPPSKQKKYIIVCTDYLTKWDETKEVKVATEEKVANFLRENVFYKFGYHRELVIDQGSQFTSNMIEDLRNHHKINHRTSTPYYPQANGKLEVTNRAQEGILTKVENSSRKDWAERLVEATGPIIPHGRPPLDSHYLDLSNARKERLFQLNGLDEFRMQALLHTEVVQLQRKIWHDKNIKEKQF